MFSDNFIKSELFASLLKEASKGSGGNVSSTMEKLYKLAQTKNLEIMQLDIDDILFSKVSDEEKYNLLYSFLTKNLNNIAEAISKMPGDNIGKSNALEMIYDSEGGVNKLGNPVAPKQPVFLRKQGRGVI
jgi:hypothetical protein